MQKILFFLGNSMTLEFGRICDFIVRNFVVIWEAPTKKEKTSELITRVVSPQAIFNPI